MHMKHASKGTHGSMIIQRDQRASSSACEHGEASRHPQLRVKTWRGQWAPSAQCEHREVSGHVLLSVNMERPVGVFCSV